MVRLLLSLYHRHIPNSYQGRASQIQNRYLTIDQTNAKSDQLIQIPDENKGENPIMKQLIQVFRNSDEVLGQNLTRSVTEIAKEVSSIIRTNPRWEKTLVNDFPTVNFKEPSVYNEILKQQSNAFLLLRFYTWLKRFNTSLSDPAICSMCFRKLVENKAVTAAKRFLDETKFDPEPLDLEIFLNGLCKNGLIDEAIDVIERLKVVGHCPSLQTWNLALFHSVRIKRVDAVWRLYNDMTESGVDTDVNTFGHLIRACCLEKDAVKGYELLQQVFQAGLVPDKSVFNTLISSLAKKREFGKMSGVLHNMIAKNCTPDIYTYKELILGLSSQKMLQERIRIFNELKERGYRPDRDMYTVMIRSLCREKELESAQKLWFEMIQIGIHPDEITYSAFIHGLWKNGSYDEADKFFTEMLTKTMMQPSSTSFTVLIQRLCKAGHVDDADILWQEMLKNRLEPNIYSLNQMIVGLSNKGRFEEAMKWFSYMINHGVRPLKLTSERLLQCLSEVNRLGDALSILCHFLKMGFKLEKSINDFLMHKLGTNYLCWLKND